MHRLVSFFSFFLITTGLADAQKKSLSPILNYKGDWVYNFSGGEKESLRPMGLLNAGVTFSSDSAGWWRGGTFNLELISTHGKGASATVLHDRQGISNIEAGSHPILLWEAWYHQQFGKFGIRGGLQNINSDFMCQPYADPFSCSSFGAFPTLSLNYSLPNYPVAGLGVLFSYQINRNWRLLTSCFNGTVSDIRKDKVNIRWRANIPQDGMLSISELKYISNPEKRLNSLYGLGAAFHTKSFPTVADGEKRRKNNYTVYAFGEHDFYRTSGKSAGIFLQGSYAPKDRNMAYGYSAIGFLANGFLTSNHTDKVGIGLSQLYYQKNDSEIPISAELENTIEAFVMFQVNTFISIKPTFFAVISSGERCITAGMLHFCIDLFP